MRIMHFIILLGKEDQCRQSLQIIERMEKPSTQAVTNNKKTSSDMVNDNEGQMNSEDELEEETIDEELGESEEEARESTREENEEFLDDEMEKENVVPGEDAPPSRVLTDSHQQSPRLNTG